MIRKWLPAILYLVLFFVLSPHLLPCFSSHFFADGGDGLQNIWNLWWIHKAITDLGTSPLFTDYLQFPVGTTLVGQTLNPFNGLAGLFLQPFLSLVQTHNVLIVFSFVMGEMTAFWLCWKITGSYAGSIIGGAVFTFSNFHFMHAEGHMQLVSLEWLPLFILWWVRFCESPDFRKGILAALSLFLVILCDYYYFLYCLITALLFFLWMAWKKKNAVYLFRKENVGAFLGFLVPTLVTSGAIVLLLLYHNAKDPLLGAHGSRGLSTDLLSPFIWGPHWKFRDWIEPLWRPLCGAMQNEGSVYLGLSVIALIVYTWKKRASLLISHFGFWCLAGIFFFIMSLGPNLHIAGKEIGCGIYFRFGGKDINALLLPYAFFWLIFPPLRLSGVPVRMMVMVQLVAAILVAGGILALLKMRSPWKYVLITTFLAAVFFEYLPAPVPLTKPAHPAYVETLKNLPTGSVLDLVSPMTWALYYQTVHQKKMGFGYISRMPTSVERQNQRIADLIRAGAWKELVGDFHFTYIVKGPVAADIGVNTLPKGTPLPEIPREKMVFNGDGVSIYRF